MATYNHIIVWIFQSTSYIHSLIKTCVEMVALVFCYIAGFQFILHILAIFNIVCKSYIAYGWLLILESPDNTTTPIPLIRNTAMSDKIIFISEDVFTIVIYCVIIFILSIASVVSIFRILSLKCYVIVLSIITDILVAIIFISNLVGAIFYFKNYIVGGIFNVTMCIYLAGLFTHIIRFIRFVNFYCKKGYVRINDEDENQLYTFFLFVIFRNK